MRATWCPTLSTARSSAASASGARRVRLHEMALEVDGDLAELRLGEAAVLLLGEVDLDAPGVVGELGDAGHLLPRHRFEAGRHRTVLAPDHDVHRAPPRVRRCASRTRHESTGHDGGGVRAAVSATTSCASATRSARAAGGERRARRRDVVDHAARAGGAPDARRSAGRDGGRRRPSRSAAGPGSRSRSPTTRSAAAAAPPPGPGARRDRSPRRRRRSRLVGAQVTSVGPRPRSAAATSTMASASHGTTARTLRYFTRATSSRATPS